ncbi:unnamed protein product [Dicrocoelium dendriticum]|nr:unnamed protein product [Dicrocoelium dendriticum]
MEGRFVSALAETRFRHGVDDAEEGEVNDGSEPEDVESGLPGCLSTFLLDPAAPPTGSPRIFNHVQPSTLLPGFRPSFNPEYFRFNPMGPPTPTTGPFPGTLPQRQDTNNMFPPREPPGHSVEIGVNTPTRNDPPPNTMVQRFNMPRFTHPPPFPFIPPPGGPPTMLPPSGAPGFGTPDGLTQHPPPRPTLPSALIPPTPPAPTTGSQQEIEQMHRMYQRACQLYERAVAKVNSSASTLPLGPPPRPPPPPFLPIPVTPETVANRAPLGAPPITSTTGGGAPFPSPTDHPGMRAPVSLQDPKPSTEPSSRPEFPPPPPRLNLPPASQASLARLPQSTYDVAYAAAYKQTMAVMPSPASGGPAPNTPEHAATWQRYMDYHLRYYLQAYASMTTNNDPTASNPVIDVPLTTSAQTSTPVVTSCDASSGAHSLMVTETPAPVFTMSSKPIAPSESSSTSPKRTRRNNTSPVQEERSSETLSNTITDSNSGFETNAAGSNAPKVAPAVMLEDTRSSKCIWISNLAQGVKAVELKERCAPYGHVQTIKIIGSRKSTPPSIYAYLVMETADAAQRLVEGLQGAMFHNQEIKIKRINALPIP